MSVFGFSTQASDGNADIVPVVKYDARAGRFFRVDRTQTANGWEVNPVDITGTFKALFDLENIEVGWLHFAAGSAPMFSLVKMGEPLPSRPSPDFKNGVRFMMKLTKDNGGDVREISGTSKVFLQGVEALYLEYLEGVKANPGKLPIVSLVKTTPVKSGSGAQTSTNYAPTFKIEGWGNRGDLVFKAKSQGASQAQSTATPPSTGSTPMPPPAQKVPEPELESEFG